MDNSILNNVKKILNVHISDTAFDEDMLLHINSVFATLNQLGVGPSEGFAIKDETSKWEDFIGANSPQYNSVKTYVALAVRSYFDPPSTSFALEAMRKQIEQLEWRLNVVRENELLDEVS